jgi:hypothetical protein
MRLNALLTRSQAPRIQHPVAIVMPEKTVVFWLVSKYVCVFDKKPRSLQCYTVYENTTAANGCSRPTHLSCLRVAVAANANKRLPKLAKQRKQNQGSSGPSI